MQIIRAGMWPGSWILPQTVFTMQVLRDFSLLTLQGTISAHDYWQYLIRSTDNIDPHSLPVSTDFPAMSFQPG